MALGRQRERQTDMLVSWAEMPRSPGHAFTGDGAYDRDDVYDAVAERHPDAAVIVPPRATAVPSDAADTAPTQCDQHLKQIAERGRMGWQRLQSARLGGRGDRPVQAGDR